MQAEPVAFDRAATIDKLEGLAGEAAGAGARLALFPETFVPVYPSNRWVRYLAGWDGPEAGAAREVFARLMQQSVTVPGPDSDRLADIARTNELWLAVGVKLALHHRKLMPTNHERLVWGLGDGRGLETIATDLGKVGGLICWENLMPLARFALYEGGVEVYLAPTADDSEDWHDSMKHIAREARAFVLSCCVFQRAASYPTDVPLAEGDELVGAGGSAILAPDGTYLAGPLWNEEGILYADLDPQRLYEARQRFDPAGHYNRPDVLRFKLATSRSAG